MDSALSSLLEKILPSHRATAEEVLDAIWCVSQIEVPMERKKPDALADQKPEDESQAESSQVEKDLLPPAKPPAYQPQPSATVPFPSPGASEDPGDVAVLGLRDGLILPQLRGAGSQPAPSPTFRNVHLHGGLPLEHQRDALLRALRPLRRNRENIPGPLDEEQTLVHRRERGLFLPVFQPAKRNTFRLTLVLEGSRSSRFWTEWALEFRRILRRGSRLPVDFFHLRWEQAAQDPSRSAFILSQQLDAGGISVRHLAVPAPRRRILVFSDMASAWWRDGHLPDLIQTWSRAHPVTIVNPAPPSVWERTVYNRAGKGAARVQGHAIRWQQKEDSLPRTRCKPVFLARLDPLSLRNWAEAISGEIVAAHHAILLPGNYRPAPRVGPPALPSLPPLESLDAQELQQRLDRAEKGLLRPGALSLFQALAAVPLTPAIMRLVQQGLFPHLSHEHLAEILYSRLLTQKSDQAGREPDQMVYDFYRLTGEADPVPLRHRLFRARRWEQLQVAERLVLRYLAEQSGLDVRLLQAFVRGEGEREVLPAGLPPEILDFLLLLGRTWRTYRGQVVEGPPAEDDSLIDLLAGLPDGPVNRELVDHYRAFSADGDRQRADAARERAVGGGLLAWMGRDDLRALRQMLEHREIRPGLSAGPDEQWQRLTWRAALERGEQSGWVFWADRSHPAFQKLPEAFRQRVAGPVSEVLLRHVELREVRWDGTTTWAEPVQRALQELERPLAAGLLSDDYRPDQKLDEPPPPPTDDRPAAFTNSAGMTMVGIPSGTFIMGSPPDEPGREPGDAKETRHLVTLTQPFWIAKTPVTQGAWKLLMGTTVEEQKAKGSAHGEVTGTGDDHPVYFVNCEEALGFCDRLSEREGAATRLPEGYVYTLPTEAQWEYACRAGTEGAFNVAGVQLPDLGWFSGNSGGATHPVGEKAPNSWGLQDCHGNIVEWCADSYVKDLGSGPVTDPQGPASGGVRVLRGGSWDHSARLCRSAFRNWNAAGDRYDRIGFRPVLARQEQRAQLRALEPEPELSGIRESFVPAANGPHGMTFVPVKAGTFMMGSPEGEEGRYDREDIHPVTLTQEFEMAETPVTQGQWVFAMGGENPSHFQEPGPEAPVERVSWEDAVNFCKKLSAEDLEWDYRLPTEAEWEYACRAGTSGPYNVEGSQLSDLAWFDGNSGNQTHPVKRKKANAWGLYDCHGNVYEWCQDWFTAHVGTEPVMDPQGPATGFSRVLRGGSWSYGAQYCRSASRDDRSPVHPHFSIGFRPVRTNKAVGAAPEREQTQEAAVKAGTRSAELAVRDFAVPVAPGMKMVALPAGSFTMGEGAEAHPVTLAEDFFLAETPVTQAQWQAVMGNNPSHFQGSDLPVEKVNWEDATSFCAKLNEVAPAVEGWEWALPTEAQWEYACRAGTTTAFSFGDALNSTQANCNGTIPDGTAEKGPYLQKTSPVKSYPANPWDLFDMHGNVLEWCADWHGEYLKEAVTDPKGQVSPRPNYGITRIDQPEKKNHGFYVRITKAGQTTQKYFSDKDSGGRENARKLAMEFRDQLLGSVGHRVLRGGSWGDGAKDCRSAARHDATPVARSPYIGFRPVLTRKTKAEVAAPEPEPTQEAAVDQTLSSSATTRSPAYVAADFQNSFGMDLICLEPATFTMGSPIDEEGREPGDAKETQHPVTFTQPFWMAKTPVTQGVWKQLMGTTVAEQRAKGNSSGEVTGTGDNHPVYFVNWEEALRFCDRLSEREGAANRLPENYVYTLPTEAQWEYACRAGTQGAFNVDGSGLEDLGWFSGNSGASTHPVGQKQPNGWGLQDCHGNVLEWCADWYEKDLGSEPAMDPAGPATGDFRVLRGGSWSDTAQDCRSASRLRFNPDFRYDFIGFRPVLARKEQRAKLGALTAEPVSEPTQEAATPAQTAAEQRSGPRFVPIRAGKFVMGSPKSEQGRYQDEKQHELTLTRDFEIAETPVTQAQWEAVMGSNPSKFKESGPEAPVEQVSWQDAVDYCSRLTEQDRDGWVYRLPTEAEWEYACRAGTTGANNVDRASLKDLAWFAENAGSQTHPVKEKAPNAWGLYDCHGNVLEWCADWFTEDLGSKAVTDPQGPGSDRVLRGGSWDCDAQDCRSAYRFRYDPGNRDDNFGFRPVRQKKAEGAVLKAAAEPEAGARSGHTSLLGRLFGGKR